MNCEIVYRQPVLRASVGQFILLPPRPANVACLKMQVQLLMPTLLQPSPPWLPLSLIDTLPPSREKWWPSVISDSLRQLNLQTLPSTSLREKRERESSVAGGAVWRIHSYSWFWWSALAAFLFVPAMVYVPLFLFFLCFVLFFLWGTTLRWFF